MARRGYGRGKMKHGGFVGNLARLGGRTSKLQLAGDMRAEHLQSHGAKKAAKQAHKRV